MTPKNRLAQAVGLSALVLVVWSGCRRVPIPARPPARLAAETVGVAALPPRVQRGVSFVHSWEQGGAQGYGSPASRKSLEELHTLGANWISVMPFGFVAALDADAVHFRHEGGAATRFHTAGETDDRIYRQIADAHAQGFKVLLKPHLWVRQGSWCGSINPATPERWARFWDSYQQFILHYADVAQRAGADLLAVGVELGTTTARDPQHWRGLIAQVRQTYPGPLVYGANWDEVARVPFWDALDYIGVQFYAPLADTPDAAEAAMAARLAGHLDQLGDLAQRLGKRVLFTEVGYKAIHGTAVQPHLWPEHLRGSAVELSGAAQAQAYRTFFHGIQGRPWVAGLYLWKWFSNPDSTEEDGAGFSPRRKPAEAVIRAAFSAP